MGRFAKEYQQDRSRYLKDLENLQKLGNNHLKKPAQPSLEKNSENIENGKPIMKDYDNNVKVGAQTDKTDTQTTYGIKSIGFDEREKFFETKYGGFVKERNDIPSISDCIAFGFNHITFRKYLKRWKEEGKAKIIKTGNRKKVLWRGYEDYAKLPHETKNADISAVASNDGSRLLDNTHIKEYLAGIMGNSDLEKLSEEAIKIMNFFCSDNARATDEKISEIIGLPEKKTRHHLTILKEKGIFFYDVDERENKWKTYYWGFKGHEILRNCYISDTQKRIEEIEEEIKKKIVKPKYVCEKFNGKHPILDFGLDDFEEIGYKCKVCGEPLVFKAGEEMIKPLEDELEKLRRNIEEVKKIKLNGFAKTG